MVFRLVELDQVRLASVLVSVAAAVAAVAAIAPAAAALAAVAAAAAAASATAAAAHLFYRYLRPLHRRSDCPKLHSLAQLSVELRQQSDLLHHADCARHWKAPDSDLL
jgi:hypothetical protein